MTTPFPIDDILNLPSKLAILRVFVSRKGFKGTGRGDRKAFRLPAPSTHESLKDLHVRDVLSLDIIGKQHVYSLNEGNRIVQKVIRPMFRAEGGFKEEVRDFLLDEMRKARIKGAVASLILYGSAQKGTTGKKAMLISPSSFPGRRMWSGWRTFLFQVQPRDLRSISEPSLIRT